MNYGQYKTMCKPKEEGGDAGGSFRAARADCKLGDAIKEDNKSKALVMRGLPWKITADEIKEFFADFGTIEESNIFIECTDGKNTGSGLVIFESEDKAQDAKEKKEKEKIGVAQRWVNLFDEHDNFFQKACGLPQGDDGY